MNREQAIESLREWISDPNYWISRSSPMGLHQQYLEDIWNEALRLTQGDPSEALTVTTEAVKSSQQPNESEYQYHARLNGLPSKAFGGSDVFTGEDKLQHFFRSARIAYDAGESVSKAAGIFWEIADWLGSFFKDTGGIDQGDLWADNLGAAFGAALRWNPDQSIDRFLKAAPGAGDAVALRLGAPYAVNNYVAEIIIPSPEGLRNGELIELRCVDERGYAYVMGVSADPSDGTVEYKRLNGSAYQLARNDPWYVPPQPPQFDPELMERQQISIPTIEEREIQRKAQTGEQLRQRLQADFDQLQTQHAVLAERMAQARTDQEYQQFLLRDQQARQRLDQMQQHLHNNSNAIEDLRRQGEAFQAERLRAFEQAHSETHNSIAQEARAQQIQQMREAEESRQREQQRRDNEHQIRNQMERDHERQREELNRQIRLQTNEHGPIRLVPPITNPSFPNA